MKADVIVVDSHAVARVQLEQMDAACAAVIRRATPPDRVSPEIGVAPARGAMIAEVPREVVHSSSGPRVVRSGPSGFDRVRRGDAFDLMEEQARRAHPEMIRRALADYERREAEGWPKERARHDEAMEKVRAGGGRIRRFRPPAFVAPMFEPPFDGGQVQAGRDYAALTERVASSGVKCASLEALRSGGGGGSGGVSEAVARDMQRLAALHVRIGAGLAKDVVRPSRGGMRSTITVRTLVDDVCLGDRTLAQVLRRHGWADDTRVKAVLRGHLRGALDRMRGYSLAQPKNNV
ncbi:hypothetical protein GCM10022290_09380 [Sagittula marina]